MLSPVAGTNIALYKQLHGAGWEAARLTEVRDGYECAARLFAGHYRASGKPFIAHLVGTASILAALGADTKVVIAGMLHATYERGDFGLTRWRHRRAKLRRAIGDEAEALVWRYQELGWHDKAVARFRDELATLTAIDRKVLLMRLANDLDDNLDLEMRYCDPGRDQRQSRGDTLIALARAIDRPVLADALAAAFREAEAGAWAEALSLNRRESYQLASPFGMRLLQLTRAVIDVVPR